MKIGLEIPFSQNLPKGRKVAMVFDNAKYHSRLVERSPTINMRKDQMIAFIKKHDISIPEPVPVKAVLLERICQARIQKENVTDKIAKEAGFVVLPLPPCHCVLNPIEMVWGQMKYHARHLNIFTGQPGKIIELIMKIFAEKISVKNWRNYVLHVKKKEGRFKKMDNMVDDIKECRFQVEPFESSDDDIEELSD